MRRGDRRLGFLTEADETWAPATGAAVRDLYEAAGYRAPAADESELAALEAARDRVTQAGHQVTDAERAVSETTGAAESEILAAQAEVLAAEDSLELARITQTGANESAQRELAAAEAALVQAEEHADVAAQRLGEAEAGTDPDTGQPPTADELAALRAESEEAEDGSARVEVEDEPGVTRFVQVTPGLAAGGLVEITPVEGDLEEGDLVVVGREGSDG